MEELEHRLRSLMIAGLTGDAAAYRSLLDTLRRHLIAYFRRRLGSDADQAEDLVQETLVAVHTKRATYDPGRPFTVWIHAIARYKLIDHLRRNRLRRHLPLEDAGSVFADDGSDLSARMDVDRLLEMLPDRPRSLIRRVRLEGESIAEAAAASGMSESAVKVSIHRGVRKLSAQLQGKSKP